MEDIRIKQLPAIADASGVADNDALALSDTSDNGDEKKVAISVVAAKVLGGRSFGGAGNIITADDSNQTMTGKKLVSPRLNSETPVTLAGEVANKLIGWDGQASDLNKLTGIATTKAQLGYVAGAKSNLQDQIDALGAADITDRVYSYHAYKTAQAGSGVVIDASSLISAAGLGGRYKVLPSSLNITVQNKVAANNWEVLPPDASPLEYVHIATTAAPISGGTILSQITIKTESGGEELAIAITFRVMIDQIVA